MNYKQFLASIALEDIAANQNCDGMSNSIYSHFVDAYHKHVFTGNLDIVQNSSLKEIMKKGTKFRICPKLNIDSIFQDTCDAFDSYCMKWAKKEKIEFQKFKGWLSNLKKSL